MHQNKFIHIKMSEEKENKNEQNKEEIQDDKELILKKGLEKFRINYLFFPNSQPKTELKTLCPKCLNIPNISLSKESEQKLYVKCMGCRYCYCCSFPYSKTLDDYITLMVKMHQEVIKCEIHKAKGEDIDAFYSCEYCQKWMCNECINEHVKQKEYEEHNYYHILKADKDSNKRNTICPEHNLENYYYISMDFTYGDNVCKKCDIDYDDPDNDIIRIPTEKGECYFNQLKQIIKKSVYYLDIYCKNIYDNLINSIKDKPDLIKKAKEIYEQFLVRNRRVLFYYQMVINTGTPSIANYNLINNISDCLDTKLEKINIDLTKKLNSETVEQILTFFDKNYIVGVKEEKLDDIKDITNIQEIKEIYSIKIEPNKNKESEIKKEEVKDNKKEDENDDENKKINIIDILPLCYTKIVAAAENGEIYIYEIDNKNINVKFILCQKAHDKTIVSLDKMKNTKNKFVTCDDKKIKIWSINKTNNEYTINCETTLNEYSKSNYVYLYVLNDSNSISFIDEDNTVMILNAFYKPFFNVNYQIKRLKALYQIKSNDENDSIFILGGKGNLILYSLLEEIKYLGNLYIDCFSGKSLFYLGNDKLLVGGKNNIYLVNIKNIKLEQVIKVGPSECTCFFKYNDIILCGYGDTSICTCWSSGIAQEKLTRFLIVKKNDENLEHYLIENDYYQRGITNAIMIDKDKFISCFYRDDCLKIFQIK